MSTTFTYNSFSEQTGISQSIVPSGTPVYSTSNSFDPQGNLTSSTFTNYYNTTSTSQTTTYTVNSAGLPTSMTDPNGNTYNYTYNSQNLLVQETDPLTDPTWTYDVAGNVTSYTNQAGVTTTYTYDVMGRLLQETIPISASTNSVYTFSYDAVGNLISKSVPLYYSGSTLVSATTRYTYNALNQLASTTDPLGNVTTYTHDNAGNLIGVTDPLGNTTTYAYDADNRLVRTTVPISGSGATQISAVTTQTVNDAGLVTAVTNPLGQTTQYGYNPRNWLASVTDPMGNEVLYDYFYSGKLSTKTLQSAGGASQTVSYSYDSAGNLRHMVDAQGNATDYSYDLDNNLVSVQGANNGQGNVTYTYDALNRRTSATDANGNTTQYAYDAVGNLIQVTDPLGNVTTYTYDDQNHLLSVTTPTGAVTTYTYNLAGWQTSETDPDGNTTSYVYNADGLLVGETNPLGYTASYAYDADGRLIDYTDYMGNQTLYAYNEAGEKTSETWLNPQGQQTYQASYTYDLAENLTSASDPFSAYSNTYDADNELTQQTVTYPGLSSQPLVTLTYGYDGMGDRSSLSDSLGAQTSYTFIGGGLQELSMTAPGASAPITVSITDQNDLPSAIDYTAEGNTITAQYTRDAVGNVTGISYLDPNENEIGHASLAYTYNGDNQATSYTASDGTTVNYAYDASGQLTGVSGGQTAAYSFDLNGNRTMSGYQTGAGNQMLSDGSNSDTYNANGELATRTDSSGNVWTYTWDDRGRLTEIVEVSSEGQQLLDKKLIYDVNNNLIGTIVNGVPQQWTVWDGKNPYLQFDGARNLTLRYLANPVALDQLFGQVATSGDVEWLLTDGEGSVVMTADSSGNLLNQIKYDGFGNVVSSIAPASLPTYLFQGGYFDTDLGLYRFGARWYDPASGRWISQDPLGLQPDTNVYRFVLNAPTNASDPSGMAPSGGGVPDPSVSDYWNFFTSELFRDMAFIELRNYYNENGFLFGSTLGPNCFVVPQGLVRWYRLERSLINWLRTHPPTNPQWVQKLADLNAVRAIINAFPR